MEGSRIDDDAGAHLQRVSEALTTAYLNEKFAPELLPAHEALVERIKQLTEEQGDFVADLDEQATLQRSLYEMELERLNFVLRQYLKARVEKIQRFALHLEAQLAAAAQDDDSMQGLLTEPEEKFLRGYLQLYQQHVDAVWAMDGESQQLPERIRSIQTTQSLVLKPDLNANVFCRAERDCAPFSLPLSDEGDVELKQGDVVLLPYGPIRGLVLDGSVCLT